MASFFRVLALWLVLLGSAHAASPVPPSELWFFNDPVTDKETGPFASPDAACSAVYGRLASGDSSGISTGGLGYDPNYNACAYKKMNKGQEYFRGFHAVRKRVACPADYTPRADGLCEPPPTQCEGGRERDSSGQCVCKAGTKEPASGVGACVPTVTDDSRCEAAALLHNSVGTNRIGRISGKHPLGVEVKVCRDSGVTGNSGQPLGCLHLFTGEVSFKKPDGWVTEGESWALTDSAAGNGAGLACALGLDKDPDKPEDANKVPEEKRPDGKCAGGYSGTVNGLSVCIDRASGEQNGVDWSRSTDATGAQTEVRTTVSCVGDRCTVTQVRNTTGGSSGGASSTTVTSDVPRAQVCSTNPKNPVCGVPVGSSTKPGSSGGGGGNGSGDGTCTGDNCGEGPKSSFGGSCTAGFSCDGDAVQCAMAREQHTRNCQMLQTDQPDSDYKAAADGTDESSAEKLKGKAQQVSISSFDQRGFGWGSSCPPDPEIALGFVQASFSIPFSRICGPLSVLSLAGVGITLLGSLVWVLGGKKSS